MVVHEIGESGYYVDAKLAKHWDKHSLKVMKKANQDRVYIVDGMERSGKSTFALQQAGYLDPDMFKDINTFISRVCYTPEEFFHAIRHVKNGVIVFDEAFRGFSSRSALSKTNRKLVQALMEMGQNNNIVFIVLPSFFLLDRYPALLRSNALFNIYIDKRNNKRTWRGFNRQDKNIIWQQGVKKGWSYPVKTFFKGRFYGNFPGGDEFQKAYEKKKSDAIKEMDEENERNENEKKNLQRDILIYLLYEKTDLSTYKLEELFKEYNVGLARAQIGNIIREMKEKFGK